MITMTFNCDAGTVGFAVNDDERGRNASFSGLPRGTALFPVVSFGGDGSAGCSVQVVKYSGRARPPTGVDLRY